MTCNAVRTAQKRLTEAGLAQPGALTGCTVAEIELLEDGFSLALPPCYRDFLELMGRDAGEFLVGSDYSFPKLLAFGKDAERLLRDSAVDYALPATAFVFLFHQGYTFLFFDCQDHAEDPPVFMFTEGERGPRQIADGFSGWLLGAVEADIAANKELTD